MFLQSRLDVFNFCLLYYPPCSIMSACPFSSWSFTFLNIVRPEQTLLWFQVPNHFQLVLVFLNTLCISKRDIREKKRLRPSLSPPPPIPGRNALFCLTSVFLCHPRCALTWCLNLTTNLWNALKYPGEKCSYRHQRSWIQSCILHWKHIQ